MLDAIDRSIVVSICAAIGAVATIAAAIFAARAARDARNAANVARDGLTDTESDARRRATLEQLRGLERRALPVWRARVDPGALVAEVERGDLLSALSDNFLAYLNALDLHAFAVRHRMVDRDLSDQYLRDLVPSAVTFNAVINGLRRVANDQTMYRELEAYISRLATEFPAAPRPVTPAGQAAIQATAAPATPPAIERERAPSPSPTAGVRATADAIRRPSASNPAAPPGALATVSHRRNLSLDEALESAIARDEAR
ncbi:MAG: hypothetical protein ABJD07_01350 [Gemmatimonadaceae bacterium]